MLDRSILVLGALLVLSLAVSAQVSVPWSSRHDGGLSQSDYAHSIAVAADGSSYLAGSTYNLTSGSPPPPPTTDAIVTKLTTTGAVAWSQRWNGPLNGNDRLERVAIDTSGVVWCGGYAAGYSSGSYQTSSLLLRYDTAGALLSSRTLGDTSGPNNIRSLLVTSGGVVYGCGHDGANGGDAVVWRFYPDGSTAWMTRIPELFAGAYDTAYELALGPGGDIYVSGLLGTVAGGTGQESSAFVARLAANGSLAWVRSTPGSAGNASVFYSLVSNATGAVCAVGAIYSSATAQDGVALVYDTAGTQLLRSDFVSAGADYARGVATDAWGRFFVGADGALGTTGRDFAMELLSVQGTQAQVLWRTVVDGGGLGDDSLRRVCVLPSGDLVAAGTGPSAPGSGLDAVVLGLDGTGAVRWRQVFATPGSEQVFACVPGPDTSLVIGGWLDTAGITNSNDQWAVRMVRTARAFCTGENNAACPCGNTSTLGFQAGCASSLGAGGRLIDEGSSSLAADSLVLRGSSMPNSSALYFQGTSASIGIPFGDGLRCATGGFVRLATRTNTAGGSAYPTSGDASISVRGAVTAPGVRSYQVWYRNTATFCTTSAFNLSNGLQVLWEL